MNNKTVEEIAAELYPIFYVDPPHCKGNSERQEGFKAGYNYLLAENQKLREDRDSLYQEFYGLIEERNALKDKIEDGENEEEQRLIGYLPNHSKEKIKKVRIVGWVQEADLRIVASNEPPYTDQGCENYWKDKLLLDKKNKKTIYNLTEELKQDCQVKPGIKNINKQAEPISKPYKPCKNYGPELE